VSRGERLLEAVWERRGLAGRMGYVALRPLSEGFGAAVGLRNLAYRIGVLRARRAELPVVSVGNLAVGGTGKTPFTLWLSRSLAAHGLRVGILSRGYGGTASAVTIVSRGEGPEVDVGTVGDEAVMLAKSFAGPVVTSPRRIAGSEALADLGCHLVVLDDGFQHRAIARDFDIVLLDGRRGPLLPAGPLRERPRALRRADAVVFKEPPGAPPERAPQVVTTGLSFHMRLEPVSVVEAVGRRWQERSLGSLAGRRVVAVVGVARPESFYELLRRWDAEIEDVFEFPDHHRYTQVDWQQIARRSQQVDLVVTTEKDLVKLEAFPFATSKLVALRIEPRVKNGDELICAILAKTGLGARAGGMNDGDKSGAAGDPGVPEM
jgi:tetraacyldisaccharide 4'-kinase